MEDLMKTKKKLESIFRKAKARYVLEKLYPMVADNFETNDPSIRYSDDFKITAFGDDLKIAAFGRALGSGYSFGVGNCYSCLVEHYNFNPNNNEDRTMEGGSPEAQVSERTSTFKGSETSIPLYSKMHCIGKGNIDFTGWGRDIRTFDYHI